MGRVDGAKPMRMPPAGVRSLLLHVDEFIRLVDALDTGAPVYRHSIQSQAVAQDRARTQLIRRWLRKLEVNAVRGQFFEVARIGEKPERLFRGYRYDLRTLQPVNRHASMLARNFAVDPPQRPCYHPFILKRRRIQMQRVTEHNNRIAECARSL